MQLIQKIPVHALAHITGGGLLDNVPRVLPDNCSAQIHKHSWQQAPIFDWLQEHGNLSEKERYRTFNCGIGMVVCVAQENVAEALRLLKNLGETAWVIGEVIKAEGSPKIQLQS